MLKIKGTEKIRNEEVLQRINLPDTMLLQMITTGERKFLKSKVQQDYLFKVVAEMKVVAKAGRR